MLKEAEEKIKLIKQERNKPTNPIWAVYYKENGTEKYSLIQAKDTMEAEQKFKEIWVNTPKEVTKVKHIYR